MASSQHTLNFNGISDNGCVGISILLFVTRRFTLYWRSRESIFESVVCREIFYCILINKIMIRNNI